MTHGSLFSGIGGIDLGFEMAGIETSWTCELDEWCHKLLKERFPNAKHYRDILEVNKDLLQRVDIISGGFPCQDISTAGKGEGLDGKRSGLWFEMWRIICELRPKWVLIENVANLTNKGGVRVLQDLAEAGYNAEWQVISARDVGAKHIRKRLWIVAYRQDVQHSIEQRLERYLHFSKQQNREQERETLQQRTCEHAIHRGDIKLSNSSCNEHTKPSSKTSRNNKDGQVYNKKESKTRDDLRSKTPGCNNVSTSTTTKGRKSEGGKGENRTLGKFRIQAFKGLKDEPSVDRVAYGLSQKLDKYYDRVKGLGNGVVPQIPFLIGKRIKYLNNILEE